MTLLIALFLTLSSVFSNIDLDEPVVQSIKQPAPEPVIGSSLVWDNGVVYEDGVIVGGE